MKTATEEAIQLDRMIERAGRIASRLTFRWTDCKSDRTAAGLKPRVLAAWRRVDRLVDLRDSAAIPTR